MALKPTSKTLSCNQLKWICKAIRFQSRLPCGNTVQLISWVPMPKTASVIPWRFAILTNSSGYMALPTLKKVASAMAAQKQYRKDLFQYTIQQNP